MSSEISKKEEFIPVTQVLNEQPMLGSIPGEQVFPWATITLASFIIGQGLLGLSWLGIGLISAWGCSTWWVLTGDESWRFLSKFIHPPQLTVGHLPNSNLLHQATSVIHESETRQKESQNS